MNMNKRAVLVVCLLCVFVAVGTVAQAGPGGGGDTDQRLTDLENGLATLEGEFSTLSDSLTDLTEYIGIDAGDDSRWVGWSNSSSSGDRSFTAGYNSTASGDDSIAIGTGSWAASAGSIAIGQGAVALSSVALGTGAQATGFQSTAIGDNSVASGSRSTALGDGATATADNSVAIGAGSVANRPNTVSFGAPGAERQLTNVAPGTAPTDAANMAQLYAVSERVGQNARRISQNRSLIEQNRTLIEQNRQSIERLDRQVGRVKDRAYSGVAAAATLDTLVPPSGPNKTTLMGGVAYYEGESAVGVNATHHLGIRKLEEQRVYVNAGVSVTTQETVLGRLMAGFEF